MKTILKAIWILLAALAAASCKGFLDTVPTTSVSSGRMWTTEEMADAGMAALWEREVVRRAP